MNEAFVAVCLADEPIGSKRLCARAPRRSLAWTVQPKQPYRCTPAPPTHDPIAHSRPGQCAFWHKRALGDRRSGVWPVFRGGQGHTRSY
jgi:hypothetical protein